LEIQSLDKVPVENLFEMALLVLLKSVPTICRSGRESNPEEQQGFQEILNFKKSKPVSCMKCSIRLLSAEVEDGFYGLHASYHCV
jgi:hypothetical protein